MEESLGHLGEEEADGGVEEERGLLVATSRAEVDDGNGDLALRSAADKAIAREDGERRSHHKQDLGPIKQIPGLLHDGGGHVFTKEDNVRFEEPLTARAVRHLKISRGWGGLRGEVYIAIRGERSLMCGPGGVEGEQLLLEGKAGEKMAASKATDALQSAMQFDDLLATGGLMQAVYILGDDSLDQAGFF